MRNFLAGDLNCRNVDIWHQVQPTKLSRSWEGESTERKGNFWSHRLRKEETGRLRAVSSTSVNEHSLLKDWVFTCWLSAPLCWSKRMFNWYGNEPATSYIFFSHPVSSHRGWIGIWALQRSEIFFPQTQIFSLLCSCFLFLYFPCFSSAFSVFLIMTTVVKDKHCSQQCCSNKATIKIAKRMQIKYHNHLEAVVSIKYKYFQL